MSTAHKQVISHGGVSFKLPAAVHQTLSKSNNGGKKVTAAVSWHKSSL